MGRSRTVSWVVGGLVVALALTAAAWFFVISPRLESAADMEEQAASESERVDLLNIQLAGLKEDFANLDDFKEQLAELRVEMPATTELSTLTRQLDEVAKQAQVFVVSLTPGTPLLITPPVVEATEATEATDETDETDETETDDTATDDTATDGTATDQTATAEVTGLYGVPFEIRIIGTFDYTVDFLVRLQTGNPRLILVTSIGATAQDESGAQSGRPAVAAGDLETVISGYAFVQLDETGQEDESAATSEDESLPVPSGQDNPFAPSS